MKKIFAIIALLVPILAMGAEKFDLRKKIEAAQKGDAAAQNEIGEYYADGGNGEFAPNYKIAIEWWKVAAQNGNTKALTNLGAALFAGNGTIADVPQGVKLWNEAAKRGDPDAQFFLGSAYCNGTGVLRDPQTAAFWWTRSAKHGNHRAQNNLAFSYARGEGVEKDIKKTFELWTQSAEEGNLVA